MPQVFTQSADLRRLGGCGAPACDTPADAPAGAGPYFAHRRGGKGRRPCRSPSAV